MVDNSNNLRKSPLDWFFRQWAVRTDISPWSEAPSDFFCWHIHQLLRDMTRQPHLASVALKRKPAAMGMKAPRAPSIVDGFCQLPSQESVDGSVGPIVCPLVLAAARASRAAICEDAENDRRLATIPGELPGVETAALWRRYGEPGRLFHVGQSWAKSRCREWMSICAACCVRGPRCSTGRSFVQGSMASHSQSTWVELRSRVRISSNCRCGM